MWNEKQAINRIIKKLTRKTVITAYQLSVEFGMGINEIASTLNLSKQGTQSAIRAGRFLNHNSELNRAELNEANELSYNVERFDTIYLFPESNVQRIQWAIQQITFPTFQIRLTA